MTSVTVTSLSFGLIGLLFIGLSIPLMQGRVPPNRFYGFRTRKTLSDPKIWYEVNRISGNDLFLGGAVITISSIIMLLIAQQWSREQVVVTLMLITIFAVSGGVLHTYILLRRM
ncbi:MAG TPA: SdpI family protein [Pyrinomonadaceae bacterium]|nr:SdpI family protein [Pyrinomonadaceae bacterium]